MSIGQDDRAQTSALSSPAASSTALEVRVEPFTSRVKMGAGIAVSQTHPAERRTAQATVDGGHDRALEALGDCASTLRAPEIGSALDNPWSSWTREARVRRFRDAGHYPF